MQNASKSRPEVLVFAMLRAAGRLIRRRDGLADMRIACPDGPAMVRALTRENIPANVIGQLARRGPRHVLHPNGHLEPIQTLPRDELYRLLDVTQ